MFAGAAREVVFSNPAVVAHINKNFIPVALKAGLVNNPPPGVEGELYREINRTRAAPQGICVMNSVGAVLDWVLSFDDEKQITEFLDYSFERYQQLPAARASATRRYRRFPGVELPQVAATASAITIPSQHEGERCPAFQQLPAGTLVGHVIGRPLGANGLPIQETVHQEDYMEARLEISTQAQRALSEAARAADDQLFPVPDLFVREIVGPAYLGQLDVSPLDYVPTGQNKARYWQFQAKQVASPSSDMVWLRLTGRSHVAGKGREWEHQVSLDWQGYAEIRANHVIHIDMVATGKERLRWQAGNILLAASPAAANLMAGHSIDLDSLVTYGIHAVAGDPK